MPRSKYTKGADGLFRTAIRTGKYDDNGRPISIRLSSSKSSADLEKKVRAIKYEIERGRTYFGEAATLEEYAPLWLETKKNRSISTYQEYEYYVNNHLGDLATMRIDYIRSSDVQNLINAHSNAPSVCKKLLLTLRQIFDMAVNEDIIQKNPCTAVALPRLVKGEKRVLTAAECKIVKEANGIDERKRALIHLFYGTGLRPAEIYALTWKDIDFRFNTINVNKALNFSRRGKTTVGLPKTNKSIRTIPAPEFVMASLLAYKDTVQYSPGNYLFGSENGLYANRTGYDDQFYRTINALGLKGVSPYSFRHNFCTMCYNAQPQIDIKTCQFLMGHSDTRMVLEVYTHLDKTNAVLSAAVNSIKF